MRFIWSNVWINYQVDCKSKYDKSWSKCFITGSQHSRGQERFVFKYIWLSFVQLNIFKWILTCKKKLGWDHFGGSKNANFKNSSLVSTWLFCCDHYQYHHPKLNLTRHIILKLTFSFFFNSLRLCKFSNFYMSCKCV